MHDSKALVRFPINALTANHFIDFVQRINANFAVQLVWKPLPANDSFLRRRIDSVISTSLPLVPGIRPLLSAAFSTVWMAITDPDGFEEWARNGGRFFTTVEVMIGSSRSMKISLVEAQ